MIKKLIELYKAKNQHFLSIDYSIYKRWWVVIKIIILLNKNYIPCEIFRKKYKNTTNFVVIGLRCNGKKTKRRTNGFAKQFISNGNHNCLYCGCVLNDSNVTTDHIVPISKFGNNCRVNLVVCCDKCNLDRGATSFYKYLKSKNYLYRRQKIIFI